MDAPKNLTGMGCQLRIATFIGLSCSDRDTCVMAHNPFSPLKGQATKGCDVGTICACQVCHDLLDMRREGWIHLREKYGFAFMEQIIRAEHTTRAHLIGAGFIVIPDGNLI
tara:strand:- start:17430 stop:17762 length:333 start_codon:yes stop_codon:yes gene_type:complete